MATAPENLRPLSIQAFEQIGQSTEHTYKLLADTLKLIDEESDRQDVEIFLAIDRIDICLSVENGQGKARFLKSLHRLNEGIPAVHVILTSRYPATYVAELLGGKEQLMEVGVDTSRPVAMHSR